MVVILLILLAAFGWWIWSMPETRMPPPQPSTVAAPAATQPQPQPPTQPAPAAAPAPPPVATGPQNPVDSLAEPDKNLPALADADAAVTSALDALLGHKTVISFLQLDGFVRRVVATVDSLPREHAAPRLWPVLPTPQHFEVQGSGAVTTISSDNGARYTPFVQFVEAIDLKRAVALYARLYPLFQSAYEELGYPGRYFNDRLVEVLDHLLKAPEITGPIEVRLTQVKGDVPSVSPWLRYEFADPRLDVLSAGQKILVRMGPENERRVKARLAELRRLVATGAAANR
jgi:hypothetical protein